MTTPTEALNNSVSRGRLVGFVLLVAFLALLLRFFVLPLLSETLDDSVENLIGRILEAIAIALLTGLSIPALAIWLGPDFKVMQQIKILDRDLDTSPAFERALKKTGRWYFRGGMGSYFRSTTLPALLKQAPPVSVVIVMLNVKDQDLLERYAGYRTAQSGRKVTASEIRESILSSIWALLEAVKKRGAISSAKVHLADTYSSFRVDLSDKEVFLTQDNPKAPALRFDSESSYYKGFEIEFAQNWATTIDLSAIGSGSARISPREFFSEQLHLDISDSEARMLGGG